MEEIEYILRTGISVALKNAAEALAQLQHAGLTTAHDTTLVGEIRKWVVADMPHTLGTEKAREIMNEAAQRHAKRLAKELGVNLDDLRKIDNPVESGEDRRSGSWGE